MVLPHKMTHCYRSIAFIFNDSLCKIEQLGIYLDARLRDKGNKTSLAGYMANKALNLQCPVCGAPAGQLCKRIDGSGPKLEPHTKRKIQAKRMAYRKNP